MKQFVPLAVSGMPDEFDAHAEGGGPVVEVQESPGKIVVSFQFPGFFQTSDERIVKGVPRPFEQINMDGVGHVAAGGRPFLPAFARYVQIPEGYSCRVTSVKTGKAITLDKMLVLPAQASATDAVGAKATFDFDKKFYESDQWYPKAVAELSGPFDIDGYRAVLLRVHPLRYNPKRRRLTGVGNVVVRLALSKSRRKKQEGDAADAGREAFGNLFLNPRRNMTARVKATPLPVVTSRRGPVFLIVYAKAFVKQAKRLAQWKNQRGLVTETVSIDTIGNDVSKLKRFLRRKRGSLFSRMRYVLLFGDVKDIVTETIVGGSFGDNKTDYYYSTSADPSSGSDVKLPWLALGRIPVRNAKEAGSAVDQIIAYEKTPPGDPAYYRRAVCAAYFQGNNASHQDERAYLQTIEQIRAYLVSLGFQAERVYVSDDANLQFYSDGTPIPADVIASIMNNPAATTRLVQATTQGQLFMAHRDHGMEQGWHRPPLTNTDLGGVTGSVPSIFYSINCLTGAWTKTTTTQCFAERLLAMPGAAPSLIAATELSGTWLNNHLIRALFDATYGGLIPTYPGSTGSYPISHYRLGDVLNYAKTYLLTVQGGAGVKDHVEIYHVVGDPTLELWRDVPRPIKLKAEFRHRPRPYQLRVELSECPPGCVVTIWVGDQLYKSIKATSTHMVIDGRPTVLRTAGRALAGRRPRITICCWAPGCRYTEVVPDLPPVRGGREVG